MPTSLDERRCSTRVRRIFRCESGHQAQSFAQTPDSESVSQPHGAYPTERFLIDGPGTPRAPHERRLMTASGQ
jgi:hypothetical protein